MCQQGLDWKLEIFVLKAGDTQVASLPNVTGYGSVFPNLRSAPKLIGEGKACVFGAAGVATTAGFYRIEVASGL